MKGPIEPCWRGWAHGRLPYFVEERTPVYGERVRLRKGRGVYSAYSPPILTSPISTFAVRW